MGKAGNIGLRKAAKSKNDEFYTQLTDIEKEMKHYKGEFKDKVIYCNCDDPRVSNFFHYFSYQFEHLGLKKLIATCYKSTNIDMFSQHDSEQSVYLEYEGVQGNNKIPLREEIEVKHLQGDGDFRSDECVELLKQSDIVVTNPPFSLFREYVTQLIEYDKKFIIIGDHNAITYKEIFKLIKNHKIWLGCDNGGTKWFQVPDEYDIKTESRKKIENGKKYFSKGSITWYTNLDHKRRHEELYLFQKYNKEDYPKYDNFKAINVNKAKDMPCDYKGLMGVPITFLDKWNPDQFEILGITTSYETNPNLIYKDVSHNEPLVNGEKKFARLIIRKK